MTASHAGIYRQLNEQAEKLERVASDVAVARMSAESTEGRMVRMQRRMGPMMKLLVASLVMSFVLLLLVFAWLFRH